MLIKDENKYIFEWGEYTIEAGLDKNFLDMLFLMRRKAMSDTGNYTRSCQVEREIDRAIDSLKNQKERSYVLFGATRILTTDISKMINDFLKNNNSKLPYSPNESEIRNILMNCLEQHFGSLKTVIETPDKEKLVLQKIKQLLVDHNI